MSSEDLLLRSAELNGGAIRDVRVFGGRIVEIEPHLAHRGERVMECDGGALVPGLHDHHCHLLACAAAQESVPCGAPDVRTAEELGRALRAASPRDGWIRGVGYHESVAGSLDRTVLDALSSNAAVRVQHRSGALWILNSRALDELALDASSPEGVERDAAGRPTGRLWRLDAWLRERLDVDAIPDLGELSRRLASYGITGVTDATPDLDEGGLRALASASFRQRVTLLGASPSDVPATMTSGPRKIVLADHSLLSYDTLVQHIARARPRPVALHCVTRVSLFLALTALAEVGSRPGDRIEHASVAPPEAVAIISGLGLAVVTQPAFIASRGDDYLDAVDDEDADFLWPFRSFLEAGVPVGCGSDAPYASLDPWLAVRTAVNRRAPSGRVVVPKERITPGEALAAYLSEAISPGGPPRRIEVGRTADLVILDGSLRQVLDNPAQERVRMTMLGGRPVYQAASELR
jgi:predicted amidohydrolase YtcJ